MNRITERFNTLKASGKTAFIAYITGGDPSLDATAEVVFALERAGCDVVEFGVPFSDPVGDGVVIQEAAQRALAAGATLPKILETVAKIREKSQVPLLLFSYFNPLLAHGVERFAADAAAVGVDGVLCVDLPPEEAGDYKTALDQHGLCTVFLAAPTTPAARIELIANQCTGFLYYISRLGVTGEQAALSETLAQEVAHVKALSPVPVAVGFGISTPDQARNVAHMADGVVVGSALVRLIAAQSGAADMPQQVEAFARSLVEAVK